MSIDPLNDSLTAWGWTRIGVGPDGTLWRAADGRTLAVPNGVTPDHWEWQGIMDRLNEPMAFSRNMADVQRDLDAWVESIPVDDDE